MSANNNNGTASTRNRDKILEAIDQLRHRKARPDIQRICSYLFRRYHIGSTEAKADLDWCVAHKYVLRVEYKGNISYRNAAKKYAQLRSLKNNPTQKAKVQASKDFMDFLTNIFGELFLKDPDYLESGVPPREIIDNILAKDNVRYTRNYIAILLVKEVSSGNLVKLDNGNFLLGPCARETKTNESVVNQGNENEQRVIKEMASSSAMRENEPTIVVIGSTPRAGEKGKTTNVKIKTRRRHFKKIGTSMKDSEEKLDSMENSNDKGGESSSVRHGGRRKKAKKVFDPSDNNIPKKRGRPQGSLNRATIEKHNSSKSNDDSRPDSRTSNGSKEQGGVCSVCHIQNKRGPNDKMVACRECSNKAHFSCLNGDDMMLKMYPDNTWQCPHCKTCVVCYETSGAGSLIVCAVCADGYHASCHQPRIAEKVKNSQKWQCINCQMPENMKFNDIQSNIGDALKIVNNDEIKSDPPSASQSRSNSRNSNLSDYNSPTPSPTPPQLSPQTTRNPTPNRSTRSNTPSQSQDSEEPEDRVEDPNIDPSIPDATHWTPEEVYQYFYKYFPEEAIVFKEQEIDGRSLLLLKRMDVLTNLNLRLGPALKIYRHVTMLQVRRDDPRLYWL